MCVRVLKEPRSRVPDEKQPAEGTDPKEKKKKKEKQIGFRSIDKSLQPKKARIGDGAIRFRPAFHVAALARAPH